MRYKVIDLGTDICCGKLEKNGTILKMESFVNSKGSRLYALPTGVNMKQIAFCPYCGANIKEIKVTEHKYMDLIQGESND